MIDIDFSRLYRNDERRERFQLKLLFLVLSVGSCVPGFVYADVIEVLGSARAQSAIVLAVEVDTAPENGVVYVQVKGPDDEMYRNTDPLNNGDGQLRMEAFHKTGRGVETLTVPMFLTSAKLIETSRHPFGVPGVYGVRLTCSRHPEATSGVGGSILYSGTIEVGAASEADLQYFALARQKPIWSLFLEQQYADEANKRDTDLLGQVLVAHIVHSTRHKGDPTHGKSEWAEPLYDLAFAVPDSSYAPYVAYYAACSYMWQKKAGFVKRTYRYELPDKRFAELNYYQKAHKALELAVERGDPYIKPFAMCFLAVLKAWAADFGGADELIRRVKSERHTPKQIADLLDQVQRYTEKHRAPTGD